MASSGREALRIAIIDHKNSAYPKHGGRLNHQVLEEVLREQLSEFTVVEPVTYIGLELQSWPVGEIVRHPPDLIFIHWSAFRRRDMSDGDAPCEVTERDHQCVRDLLDAIRDIYDGAKKHPRIIIYSRSSGICQPATRREIKETTRADADFAASIGMIALSNREEMLNSRAAKRDLRRLALHLLGKNGRFVTNDERGLCTLQR